MRGSARNVVALFVAALVFGGAGFASAYIAMKQGLLRPARIIEVECGSAAGGIVSSSRITIRCNMPREELQKVILEDLAELDVDELARAEQLNPDLVDAAAGRLWLTPGAMWAVLSELRPELSRYQKDLLLADLRGEERPDAPDGEGPVLTTAIEIALTHSGAQRNRPDGTSERPAVSDADSVAQRSIPKVGPDQVPSPGGESRYRAGATAGRGRAPAARRVEMRYARPRIRGRANRHRLRARTR